jgi:hypothetical protein
MNKKYSTGNFYLNPYLGGVLLGLVLTATFYISGRGLGASGAIKNTVVEAVNTFTPKHIPSFTWGLEGATKYDFDKSLQDIQGWKNLKHQHLQEAEKQMLKTIFEKNLHS